jgi:FlaA1/EpsC-like NDP-sugar epimerase
LTPNIPSAPPQTAGEFASQHSQALLGRPSLGEAPAQAAAWLAGHRVLITGAGGSVGQPLAAAVAGASPAALVLLDHHEASLWELHRRHAAPGVHLVLADVRHGSGLVALLREHRPDTIFHLAAYKHVPFGEAFPGEVFRVNVAATRCLLQAAVETGVERFVYPSSDKACDPPSFYGATKRLSEVLVRHVGAHASRPFNVARFVNILGTQGSVIETFAQQIRRNQPLTVTDSAMTRYWVSMNEAIWLLLSVARLDCGGQTMLLNEPNEISVVEMAHRVRKLLRGDPAASRIVFGTPRPGERLREYLVSQSESLLPGPHPSLLQVEDAAAQVHLAAIEAGVDELMLLAEQGDSAALRRVVMNVARQLQ